MRTKLKFFPQSHAIDTVLARRQLQEKGYGYVRLNKPFLYRGDTRTPEEDVFKCGFHRRIEGNIDRNPIITLNRESYDCIATTKDLVYAVGFADCPSRIYNKPEYSWVYLIYSKSGIDISDGSLYDRKGSGNAGLVNEVTLTGIAPEQILAAFQIKTTRNSICHYYDPTRFYHIEPSWHILVTDFRINPNCTIKDTDPDLYTSALNEFVKTYQKGYFFIPKAPVPEETDYVYTHNMSDFQKRAYRIGFSKEDVISNRITIDHVVAVEQSAVDPNSVLNLSQTELSGLSQGFSLEEVSGLTNAFQIDGLRKGFSKEDVLSSWFSVLHIEASCIGLEIESLRGKSMLEVYALYKRLSSEEIIGITEFYQIDALDYGFTHDDVRSTWFTYRHFLATTEGAPIELVRGKTEMELDTLLFGENLESSNNAHEQENYSNNTVFQTSNEFEGFSEDFISQKFK